MNTNLDQHHRNLLHRTKLVVFIASWAIAIPGIGSASIQVDFNQLIQNPGMYNNKRISVIGVAEVNGRFTLVQPQKRDVPHTILIIQQAEDRSLQRFDNHWVQVTGLSHTDPEGIFACKLLLEKVQLLPRPPPKGIKTFGIFLNEGPGRIKLDIVNKIGNEDTEITLGAGQIERTSVAAGTAKAFDSAGKLLSECPVEQEGSTLFDYASRTFYFRIKDGKIQAVRPEDAADIKRRWRRVEKETGHS